MIAYETKNTHPGTAPTATIYMRGILCLSFDHANKCTVAVNNVGHGHKLKFSLVYPDSDKTITLSTQAREIHIDVKGGTTGGTYVYNGGQPVSIPTINEQRFNLESSWIDLEGHRGHNTRVVNNANTLWPRFYINDGLFSASKLSAGSFALKDSNPTPVIKQLGQVALEVVADIFLNRNPDSAIEIKLPHQTISLKNNTRCQIYIDNDCDSDYASAYASAGPAASDFHLHYTAFSNAFDSLRGTLNPSDKFQLVSNTASAIDKTGSTQAQATYDPLTDRAPCMAIVLGQTSCFKS